jgi:hypothetical protein
MKTVDDALLNLRVLVIARTAIANGCRKADGREIRSLLLTRSDAEAFQYLIAAYAGPKGFWNRLMRKLGFD